MTSRLLRLSLLLLFGSPSAIDAQPLGVGYWQLRPFCNLMALQVTQHITPSGAVYALNGFDDQCGGTARASIVGTATFNQDGSIGLGLTIVTVPGGSPVHVDARLAPNSLSGSWTDSAGNGGLFVPLTGAVPRTGSPRPLEFTNESVRELSATGILYSTDGNPAVQGGSRLAEHLFVLPPVTRTWTYFLNPRRRCHRSRN